MPLLLFRHIMKHIPLDIYDEMPYSMKKYIANYGWHFNKKTYDYATSKMYKYDNNNKKEYIELYTKNKLMSF